MTCDRCGRTLTPGDTAWQFRLTLTADAVQGSRAFDGNTASDIDARIDAILERIEQMPQSMLEDQIHQEFRFVLCRKCRDIINANPLQKMWDET